MKLVANYTEFWLFSYDHEIWESMFIRSVMNSVWNGDKCITRKWGKYTCLSRGTKSGVENKSRWWSKEDKRHSGTGMLKNQGKGKEVTRYQWAKASNRPQKQSAFTNMHLPVCYDPRLHSSWKPFAMLIWCAIAITSTSQYEDLENLDHYGLSQQKHLYGVSLSLL